MTLLDVSPWDRLADRLDPPQASSDERADPVTLAAHLDQDYVLRPHLRVIGDEFKALWAGDFDRLIINTPPQVGKSLSAVEWAGFWWLVLNPKANIVIGSYNDDLALSRGRAIRRLIERYGARYGLRLERGSSAKKDWNLTSGGGVRSVGVGSGITGHPADIIFIDDPVRSRADADSLRKRDTTYDWYSADLVSRLSPGGRIVLVATPWHTDDLRARVLGAEGDKASGGRWRTIVMPAFATSADDPLGRAIGEPLSHPKVADGDVERLRKHWEDKRTTSILRDWLALYQCDPRPLEGSLLSYDLLRQRRCWQAGGPTAAEPRTIAVAVDPSGGGRDVAGIVAGYLGTNDVLHITHDRSAPMSSESWSRAACELAADVGADRIIFESNYGGDMALLAIRTAWKALRDEQPERFSEFAPRVVDVHAKRNKLLRAEPIAQQWIEGRIVTTNYMPELESEWATWQATDRDSPGRIDASVYLAFSLLPVPHSGNQNNSAGQQLASTQLLTWGGIAGRR